MRQFIGRRVLAIVTIALSAFGLHAQTWTQLTPSTQPPPRTSGAMAYDSNNGRVVLFGGMDGTGAVIGDTWLWNGVTWTKATPGTSPVARYTHVMAFDEQRRQTVLFGGLGPGAAPNETWVWDGTTWTKKTPVTNPSVALSYAMAYDPSRQKVVLVSGMSFPGQSIDTWAWDGTNWSKLSPVTAPQGHSRPLLAWDTARQAMVLFGQRNQTDSLVVWSAWDGTTWSSGPPVFPVGGGIGSATSHKGKVVFASAVGQTFIWDGTTWQLLAANPFTPAGIVGMAYDSTQDRTIALVQDASGKTQTWSFDFGSGCAFPPAESLANYDNVDVPAQGSTAPLDVNLPAGCPWTATSTQPWVTGDPATGTGPGTIARNVAANTTITAREAYFSISGRTTRLQQVAPACDTSGPLPASPFIARSGCTPVYSLTVAAGEQIAFQGVVKKVQNWTTSASVTIWNPDKTTVLATASSTGTPAVTTTDPSFRLPQSGFFTFPAAGTYPIKVLGSDDSTIEYLRTGSPCAPTLSGYSFYQSPQSLAPFTLPPAPPWSSSAWLSVGIAPGCPSVAVKSNASWLSASAATAGPGYTPVLLTPEVSADARSTTVTVGSASIPVTQPASPCAFSLSAASTSVDSNRTVVDFAVSSSQYPCAWTASSNASWLQVFPLSGDYGHSAVHYTVFPNFGTKSRIATLTIAGRTLTVTQAPSTGTPMERFVRLLYFNFFGRLPTTAEIAFHVNSGLSREQLALNFFQSQEFTLGGRFIAGLYVGLLRRDAEYGGWLFQRDALVNALNQPMQLTGNFIGSQEFYLQNGSLTPTRFVTLLYRQILFREPTPDEVTFQVGVVNRTGDWPTLAYSFLLSHEFVTGTESRLVAFLSYAGLLQRDPTAAEFTAAKGMSVANLLTGIVNSAEFAAILD